MRSVNEAGGKGHEKRHLGLALLFAAAGQLTPFTLGGQTTQSGTLTDPNPYLALLPVGAEPDWEAWNEELSRTAARRRARLEPRPAPTLLVGEAEPPGIAGANDHPRLAEPLPGFGSGPSLSTTAVLTGRLSPPPVGLLPTPEPNGSIPLAPILALGSGERVSLPGQIGDGAYGSAGTRSGDFDVLAIQGRALQRLDVLVRPDPGAPSLDPAVLLTDASGRGLAFGDDSVRGGFFVSVNAELSFVLPVDGTYYLIVGGQDTEGALNLANPFDAASGGGVTREGGYELLASLDTALRGDADHFALELRAGDVLGAVVTTGSPTLILSRPSGEILVAGRRDLTALYPAASPLPGGGAAAVAYVVEEDGSYTVGVSELHPFDDGDYRIELEIGRSPLLGSPSGRRQILFVDFDGATVERALFGGRPGELAHLSPLEAFLPAWGLTSADLDRLVDAVLGVLEENLDLDLRERGRNGDYRTSAVAGDFVVEVRHSRDHPDPGPAADVARIVVGGTTEELGFRTIGLAQDIDPGNFSTGGTAVVLLDLLSAPADDPNSLNGVEVAAGFERLAVVARGLGNIVAHEAGHLFGNFHTERDAGPPTLMDRGGRLLQLLGAGGDEILGSNDDLDVDFGVDRYAPVEGFAGVEATLQVVSFGLPAGGTRPRLVRSPLEIDFGAPAPGGSALATLTLSNGGSDTLEVQEVELTAPAELSIVGGDGRGRLAPGESAPVELRFAPTSPGETTGRLRLRSTDPTLPVVDVPLRGLGGAPSAVLDRSSHDFGSLVYGDASIAASTTFELHNPSLTGLSVESYLVGGTPGRFAIDAGGHGALAPGQRREVAMSFRPAGAVGDARAKLLIKTDDPLRPQLAIDLTGRADGPDLEVSPGTPYVFGILVLGRSGRRAFRLTNRGTRPLTLGTVRLESDGGGQMELTATPAGSTVVPAATELATVVFEPQRRGFAEGLLAVHSGDPDTPRLEISLLGWGARPELVAHPSPLRFPSGTPGSEMLAILTLDNLDPLVLLRVDPTIVGGSGAFGLQDDRPLIVPPGSSASLIVTLTVPPAGVAESAELVLETNDPLQPTTRVSLRGQGAVPIPALRWPGALALSLLLVAAGLRRLLP